MTTKEKCAQIRMFGDPDDADHGSSGCVCPVIESWETPRCMAGLAADGQVPEGVTPCTETPVLCEVHASHDGCEPVGSRDDARAEGARIYQDASGLTTQQRRDLPPYILPGFGGETCEYTDGLPEHFIARENDCGKPAPWRDYRRLSGDAEDYIPRYFCDEHVPRVDGTDLQAEYLRGRAK